MNKMDFLSDKNGWFKVGAKVRLRPDIVNFFNWGKIDEGNGRTMDADFSVNEDTIDSLSKRGFLTLGERPSSNRFKMNLVALALEECESKSVFPIEYFIPCGVEEEEIE